ncbi:hypothetical protein LSTR_LSTR003679 [Laodelphax striatellus]|uniref:Dipeptidyl peptidase 9 n=1 Tax=Laodelphax striatellus TaxID=195883 RepID=A0A482XA51_LAOST|nr:hypothetical protein LSTR_LSTR003679 [Laodelphax striatellus]
MENRKQKKSWTELKTIVSELRQQLSDLSTVIPTFISFRSLGDGRTRIFFLSTSPNSYETTLLYADVSSSDSKTDKIQWHPVIEPNFHFNLGSRYSREEQLMLERKRLASWGITSYQLDASSGKLVFPAASTLFQCVDTSHMSGPMFPAELRTNSNGPKMSPEICPTNPDLVAYVCNADIWVTHTISGSTERLTYAHKGGRNLADDPLTAGVPSYVIQEEFSRYEGYWWQPVSKDKVYRILYEETDESEVKLYSFPSSNADLNGEIEQYRFPSAGSPNAKSHLKIVQFELNEVFQIINLQTLVLPRPLFTVFPDLEYLVRVGWLSDGENIWLQMVDRKQVRLDLFILSVKNFVEPPRNIWNPPQTNSASPTPSPPPIKYVFTQESDVWINVHDLLYIFPTVENDKITMIWSSEEAGYRHLYLVTVSYMSQIVEDSRDLFVVPSFKSQVALTSGDWEVLGSDLWVDEARQLVYFLGLRESPLEKHLYVVSLQRPGEIRLLTRPGFSYSIDLNEECTICVATYSNIQKLPACQVFRIQHTDWTVEGVSLSPIGYLQEPTVPEIDLHCPELYSHKISSGDKIFSMVFRPHCYVEGEKYPTVLNVYGGPEVQLVSNTFKGMRHLRMHMLASQGYCVVMIDSRGSQHRGLQFESHIKGRMGTVELDDQVEVLQWLAQTTGMIDMERVAILGWSYGGYLSLMGLAQFSHIFKLAIAGAPVKSWCSYDTGYTERYMGLPQENKFGYRQGSVFNYIKMFPEEENRLLIIHGLIDENVHFDHTSSLIDALVKAGKPYQLQVYPNERHSLRNLDASKHYETMLLLFLQNHL